MTAARNKTVGAYGERVAARHLVDLGMTLVDRNWRCEIGELDLVLRQGEGPEAVIVVCEVKTRTGPTGGHPLAAIDGSKAARLRRLGLRWLEEHGESLERDLRVDMVGVLRRPRGRAQVLHVPGVA